jgi:signal transduction histidine kinase
VHTEFGAIPVVRGDTLHFQQVLLNLMMNAMEAMGATPAWKRYLTVRTGRNGGGDTELIVRDTGPGIATGHMSRLFDAFFTTKKNSMGLGLALCRSIVEGYGGRIWAENNASGGASFGFTLPASPADAGAGAIAKTEDFDTEKEVA